jgi:protein-L-isoaspartate(D-aspartate) O-methyltransferase
MKDTLKHQGLRNRLVAKLKAKGVQDERVLDAISQVPRHLFLDSSFERHAYDDRAFPIGADQTISHPFTVAFQTEQLQLKEGEKVLEIGTGSGYQTAVLTTMGAEVYTVERQLELFKKAKTFLPKIKCFPKVQKFGDGYVGLPVFAPFDKIIVTAGAPFIPKPLLSQLKIGGILVIPVGEETQKMNIITRTATREFEKRILGDFKFVPLLEDKN